MDNPFDLLYSKEVLKHTKNPKNVGVIKGANGIGTLGNPVCGDIMRLYLKIAKNKKGQEYIKNIKFQTLGCGAAIASTSILTTLVKGKLLSESEKLTKDDLIKALGGLPKTKIHCSLMADEALKKAIKNYRSNAILKGHQ